MDTPRLIASDLDGTLVRSDGTVAERTVQVLARAEEAGIPFVMVTGRPPRWMTEISRMTNHRGIAVCANGALVYDLHTEQVVESFLLEEDVASEIAEALRAALPDISFAVERTDLRFAHEDAYVPTYAIPDHEPAPVERLVSGGVVKLLARHGDLDSDELLAAAREAVGDRATLTHSSNEGLLEVSAAGISKATGLAALAKEHGVDAEGVVAFGDMPNDLPMLAWAGHSVAMANAHPEVLELADEVTTSNDDDGVARVLERWF
ncbi:MAG TPA: HAD family hydrolase [Mycobacteriales bacterium]|nr:HAD family hydrolase [Mycobacteriales bacterium]